MRFRRHGRLAIGCLLSVLVIGCILIAMQMSGRDLVTPLVEPVLQSDLDLEATVSSTPTAEPVHTIVPSPTSSPTFISTPIAPEPTPDVSDCTLGAVFQADVTIPDDTKVESGQPFTKTWRIRNTGTCIWGPGYSLTFVHGERMDGSDVTDLPVTDAGRDAQISVMLAAPIEEGTHRGNWQVCVRGWECFGQEVYVQIVSHNPRAPATTEATDPAATPAFERTTAICVGVVDGDTIKVDINGTVYTLRYIGIDSPETVHPSEPVEWMGPEATEANRLLVEGKTIYLEKDVSETDQYGRLLRYVFLEDGTNVNNELVRLGYAQSSTYPPDVRYQDMFIAAQQEAREAGRGLWGPTPTPLPLPTLTKQPTVPPIPATPTPAPLVQPTQPPAPSPGQVIISYIYYDGQVYRVESDEYAVVKNVGGSPVNLAGWRLNADDPGQDFRFPDFALQSGQECRVYTNEHHPETCGFSFGKSSAIWNNKGDCGHLYDASGTEVSTYCY